MYESFEGKFEAELLEEIKAFPVVEVEPDTVLVKQNDRVEHIPLLVEGAIAVNQFTEAIGNTHIYNIEPGEGCILSLVAGQKNTPSVGTGVASVKSKVIAVPCTKTKEWYDKYSSWREFISSLYDIRLQELILQRNTVTAQAREIEEQKQVITDSIHYATRIQSSVLTSEQQLKELLQLPVRGLFLPKDLLSGDFLWGTSIGDNKAAFAVADCTGHGVPGAMVSMICNKILNTVTGRLEEPDPGSILDETRHEVSSVFSQDQMEHQVRDGMDVALCIVDQGLRLLQVAMANSPAYYLTRNREIDVENTTVRFQTSQWQLVELHPDKQPIGEVESPHPFTVCEIPYTSGDVIVLTTDGLIDQFGGPKQKKITRKRFRLWIEESLNEEQADVGAGIHTHVLSKLQDWLGNNEQTDDILFLTVTLL